VDASGNLRTALQVAASAHDAAATGALTARQQLDGAVFAAFTVAAYDDATKALAGAAKKVSAGDPFDLQGGREVDRGGRTGGGGFLRQVSGGGLARPVAVPAHAANRTPSRSPG
jgi:hypothetical protein